MPNSPGFYAIFVDRADALPPPFANILIDRKTGLLYVGIATVSLLERLVEQDLYHRKASTFFRSIGAVLDKRPPAGSLVGKKNQDNYKFSKPDTDAIIEWIEKHISVRWLCLKPESRKADAELIRHLGPLFNIAYNPAVLPDLEKLREECRKIARQPRAPTAPD